MTGQPPPPPGRPSWQPATDRVAEGAGPAGGERKRRRSESRQGDAEDPASKPQRAGLKLSLKGRALRLITGREHSRLELERKLAPHEETPGELARVLDELQAKDFINESRVVESVLHRRAARLGTARIRHELQSKGLSSEAMSQALGQLKSSEIERAQAVWAKKFGNQPPADAAERARQMRFLTARGFGSEAVRRAVSTSSAVDDEPVD